jgi:hypothetical protein
VVDDVEAVSRLLGYSQLTFVGDGRWGKEVRAGRKRAIIAPARRPV